MTIPSHMKQPVEILAKGYTVYFAVTDGSKNAVPEEFCFMPKDGYVNVYHFQRGNGGTMVKRKMDKALTELSLIINTHPGIVNQDCSHIQAEVSEDGTSFTISS